MTIQCFLYIHFAALRPLLLYSDRCCYADCLYERRGAERAPSHLCRELWTPLHMYMSE